VRKHERKIRGRYRSIIEQAERLHPGTKKYVEDQGLIVHEKTSLFNPETGLAAQAAIQGKNIFVTPATDEISFLHEIGHHKQDSALKAKGLPLKQPGYTLVPVEEQASIMLSKDPVKKIARKHGISSEGVRSLKQIGLPRHGLVKPNPDELAPVKFARRLQKRRGFYAHGSGLK